MSSLDAPEAPRRPFSAKPAADRTGLPWWFVAAITAATSVSVGLASQTVPAPDRGPGVAFWAGAVAGALAVAALRSLSIAVTARLMIALGAVMILRFGQVPSDSVTGPLVVVPWVFATGLALVLAAATSRFTASDGRGRLLRRQRTGTAVLRLVVAVSCFAAAAALAYGPQASLGFSTGSSSGDPARVGPGTLGSALKATRSLDITNRPRLGDSLVMTVASERASFWRAQTFDLWDGATWTRSTELPDEIPASGQVRPEAGDLAATTGVARTEQFRIEASFATALPATPSVESVTTRSPLLQWADGSLLAPIAVGRGTTYTVRSRVVPLDQATLRRVGDLEVPESIAAAYAQPPVATSRVRELADRLTQDTDNTFEKVQAIEEWMASNTEYSLDAPLSPPGTDVVDHFLFTSRLGWCEQVASSLTVMLRLNGVPARLATGYVPSGRDPITGRFRVLERDAHAWTEVWFPEVGWVPFDPTADIPLAGTTAPGTGLAGAVSRWGVWALVALGVLGAFGTAIVAGVRVVVARVGGRSRSRRDGTVGRHREVSASQRAADEAWARRIERSLSKLGERAGRHRQPWETATGYAAALSPDLESVGAAADRARYSSDGLGADERAAAETLLAVAGTSMDLSAGARR